MKAKFIIQFSMLSALLFTFMTFQSARACVPSEDSSSICVIFRTVRPSAIPVVAAAKPAATSVPAPAPVKARRGTGPADALEMTDASQTIDANSSIWYKIGDGPNPQRFEIWMDANGRSGIGFGIFAPDQMSDLTATTPPKGRGTFNRLEPSHDLYWTGQAPQGGTWYIQVTNINPFPVPYKLSYNRAETERKQCTSYWEYIGKDYVYWTACQ